MFVLNDPGEMGRINAALGTGLQALAQGKLEHIQRQYQQQQQRAPMANFLTARGINPETAMQIASMEPKMQQLLLSNLDQLVTPQTGMGALREAQGDLQPSDASQQQSQKVQPQQSNMNELFMSPQQRQHKEKLELEKKKITSREDLAAWKNTQAYREKLLENEQAAQDALSSIKEAQRLEESGDFPSQQFAAFLKGADWENVPGFLSGDAEAYNKILANFQRGAKEIYGGRITNFEMEQFLKTIPTLQHTPEGRRHIWSMMKKYYRGAKEMGKLERKIIKENNGVPPQDLHEQVNEKFKPIAKDIAKKFKNDVEKAEKLRSKTASRIGSALSYGAGKAVGSLPGAIKGGAAGALGGATLGSVVPGLGTGAGALLGGTLGALGGGAGISQLLKTML